MVLINSYSINFIGRHISRSISIKNENGLLLTLLIKNNNDDNCFHGISWKIHIMNYTDKEFFLLLCRTYTTNKMKWVTPLWQLCMWIERQSFIHWKPPDGSSITRFIKSLTNDVVINSISMTENQRWNLSLLLCHCCWCDIKHVD